MTETKMIRTSDYDDTSVYDYCGDISANCSRQKLIQILADGVNVYRTDREKCIKLGWEEPVNEWLSSYGDVFNIIETWCRQDESFETIIDAVMTDKDDFPNIVREVLKIL